MVKILKNEGFTLIEVLVVISIIVIASAFSGFINLDSYRGYSFRSERNTLVSALQHARAQAIANICHGTSCNDGRSQGVAIRPDDNGSSYVIFQSGAISQEYAQRDSDFDVFLESSKNIVTGGSISGVVFTQLSGNVANPGNIILTDNAGHTSTISINSEGQILWTN